MLPIRPLHDNVFIDIIDRGDTIKNLGNGKVLHIIADEDFGTHNPMAGKHRGVRPRWARVLAVGNEVEEVVPGDMILCDELKWSRKIPLGRQDDKTVYFWNIKVSDILVIDDTKSSQRNAVDLAASMRGIVWSVGRI